MPKKKLTNKRYLIETISRNRGIIVTDHEKLIEKIRWKYKGGQSVPVTYKAPTAIFRVTFNNLPNCCGVTELGAFSGVDNDYDDDVTDELYKEIAEEVTSLLKRTKASLCLAHFAKREEYEEKEYSYHRFMKALLNKGWVTTGEPFLNRNYSSKHWIQGIAYLFQPRKKGNQYAKANAV